MPELPEVETVRRGLEPVLVGARLTRVRQNRPDLRFPFPERFVERLEGATVLGIDRRAPYLLTRLSTGETWVSHLGMTGRFTLDGTQIGEFEEPAPIAGKHEHMSFCAVRGDASTRVGFADARRFGFMGLIPTDQTEAHPWFAAMGPEPLGNSFSGAHLAEVFTGTPGKYVRLEDTIRGFQEILAGQHDDLPEQAFYMVGPIEGAVERAKQMSGAAA